MLERGLHWSPHLDELESAAASAYPAAS
jgi:hypothetical protein